MRGVSLVEVLVSLTISLIILAALMHFTLNSMADSRVERTRHEVRQAMMLNNELLNRIKLEPEHEFWEEFPVQTAFVHDVDHVHGAVHYTRACPKSDQSCVLIWDLAPAEDEPILYEATAGSDLESLYITPLNAASKPGPARQIGPMSVLFVETETTAFCILVKEADDHVLSMVPRASNPWPLPLAPGLFGARVFHLGKLRLHHLYLSESESRQLQLTDEEWTFKSGAWKKKPKVSHQGYLVAAHWESCNAEQPDRWLLVGRHPRAPYLEVPVKVVGKTYDQEVILANHTF